MQAGLDSIRVSLNSARPDLYTKYYRPNNYRFEDILESLRVVRRYEGWASINYFVFPGITDTEPEYEALRALVRDTGLSMIQWRNFNIDPDWYMGRMNVTEPGEAFGIKAVMTELREEFPELKFGYYNPPKERMSDFDEAFAH